MKHSFEEMVEALFKLGMPPAGSTEDQDMIWDIECNLLFELGNWDEKEFWDEYYIRKAQDQIEELTK